MQALMHIDQLEQARVLLSPIRVEILDMLRERGTCTEMARRLQTSPQRTNNHVKELLRAGFVEIVEKRPKRNMIETVYLARACSELVGEIKGLAGLVDPISHGIAGPGLGWGFPYLLFRVSCFAHFLVSVPPSTMLAG